MSKLMVAADPNVQVVAAGVAGAAGFGAWWAAATEIALAVFGVPLQVMLASVCGAFGMRALMPATSYRRALGAGLVWAMIGGWGAQLAQALIASMAAATLPIGALSGTAIVVAAAGQFLIEPGNLAKARAAVGRLLDNVGRGS